MDSVERDLLILLPEDRFSEVEIEKEAALLHKLLANAEKLEARITATEVIDINKNKVSNNPRLIAKMIDSKDLKPFQFIFNKN